MLEIDNLGLASSFKYNEKKEDEVVERIDNY